MVEFVLTFPNEVADFVRETYAQAEAVLEYGSGGSTMLAAQLGVSCIAVESDKAWTEALNTAIKVRFPYMDKVKAVHVDIGATKKWGYPLDHSRWARFWRYPMQIWENIGPAQYPDVVLIDGRMRKACFAATLLNVKRETTVLFDDYGDRSIYHEVERFAQPTRLVGRMAEFRVVEGMIDAREMATIIPWFSQLK